MKLIRDGSTIIATSTQASASLVWPVGIHNGRLLNLADSHLSGNTLYSIVTNNSDGAEWTQDGQQIQVACSASDSGQYTNYMATHISYRFWDTGVKVKENPVCTLEFATETGATAYGNHSSTTLYHTMGFVTAPEGGIASICLEDSGRTANAGTSWSSSRWCTMRWNVDGHYDTQLAHRQGGSTVSSFSSDYSSKHTDPKSFRYTFRQTEFLHTRLDGDFRFTNGYTTTNYPGSDGDGDYSAIKTITTDSTISDGDHHVYVVVAVGRKAAGGDVQTVKGKYTVWVQQIMIVELKINFVKIFGIGTASGDDGTLQRFLSQTDAGDGRIEIDGQIKTLSEAETLLSSHLSTDVTDLAKFIGLETYSDPSIGNWFNLEIVLSQFLLLFTILFIL